MNESYRQLKKKIIEKSMVLVEAGDMSSVRKAMQALNEMAKIEPGDNEQKLKEVDRLLESLGFSSEVARDEFFSKHRRTVPSVARFTDQSEDTVRKWCESGLVVCELDPTVNTKRWKICPKSVALKISDVPDPRIKRGVT